MLYNRNTAGKYIGMDRTVQGQTIQLQIKTEPSKVLTFTVYSTARFIDLYAAKTCV